MKLSKDQKNLLIGIVVYVVLAVVYNALLVCFGNKIWNDIWPTALGMLIGAVGMGVFLIIGSRIPKKRNEDKE